MQLHLWSEERGPEWTLVHTATIRLKNGRILYAKDYGRRCWVFWVKISTK